MTTISDPQLRMIIGNKLHEAVDLQRQGQLDAAEVLYGRRSDQ
jgi:hypothetical protein